MAGAVDAGNGRFERGGAGGEDQRVVGLFVFVTGVEGAHSDAPGLAVDAQHLGTHAHIEVEPGAQALRGLQQQVVRRNDLAADKVGQTAVGKRDVGSAFENGDVRLFRKPAGTRGRAGSAGDAADDDESRATHGWCVPEA